MNHEFLPWELLEPIINVQISNDNNVMLICAIISSLAAIAAAAYAAYKTSSVQKNNLYSQIVLDESRNVMNAIYKCLSIADVIVKRNERGQNIDTYRTKGQDDIDIINKEKNNLRFILGDTDCLRVISRMRSWMFHKRNDIPKQKELLKKGDELRELIDNVIFNAIKTGNMPAEEQLEEIRRRTEELYNIYNISRENDETNEENENREYPASRD